MAISHQGTMEIVFEILSAVFGFLVQLLLEILSQAVSEVLAEIGLRSLSEPFRRSRPINPFLAGFGYLLYGAGAGALTLLLPRMFLVPWWLRLINLIITPLVCGFIMAKVGQLRERRGDRKMRMDTFFYGYVFALAMAFVRLIWR
jgi:hypothetical protein